MNATFLSWKPQNTHIRLNFNSDNPMCFNVHRECSRASEDGGDDRGEQTACIDGQVEDGKEGASLLLLLDMTV